MCCYIGCPTNCVPINPLTKHCSFLKANTYLYCSFCVLICTFFSTICWVYSPPGSHPCHVTLSATSIPKWLTLRCVWTGMVNFNALAEQINKEFPSVSDTVIELKQRRTSVSEHFQSNQKNRQHQKYFWNVVVLQEKHQSGVRKLNRKQEH